MEKNKIIRIILAVVCIVAVLVLEIISASKFVLAKFLLLFANYILVLTLTKGEKHNALRMLLITILYFGLFSWFLPAATFQSELSKPEFSQVGLFDLLSNYLQTSIQYFGTFALFILVVGGFYGVLHVIPGYRTLLDKNVRALKGNEKLFVCVVIIVIAVLTSVCGAQMGMLIFFPLLASIILLLGFDKIVVALSLVGSTMVGIMGTTIASANTYYLVQSLGADEAVKYNTEIVTRSAILLVGILVLIIATLRYIKKSTTVKSGVAAKTKVSSASDTPVIIKEIKETKKTTKSSTKKNTKKSKSKGSKNNNKALAVESDVIVVKEDFGDSDLDIVPKKVGGKHSVLPIVLSYVFMFIIFVMAFIPWATTLGVNWFEKATESITKFKMFKFPIFGKLLGSNVNAFGAWSIIDLLPVLLILIVILALIYRVKAEDFIEGFVNGVRKAVVPAAIVILVYVGLVLVTFHSYQLSVYVSLFDLFGTKLNFGGLFGTSVVTLLSGLFNSDSVYTFNAILPYFMSIVTDSAGYAKVFVLMISMYGLVMLVAPTSLILLVVLSTLKISFREWFKNIWLVVLVLFVLLFAIVLIWSPIFTWILVGLLLVLLVILLVKKAI